MRFSKQLILIPLIALAAISHTALPVLGQTNPDAEANIQIDQGAAASEQFLQNNPTPKPPIETNTKPESCGWGVDISCAILYSINWILDGIAYYPVYYTSSMFIATIDLNSGDLLTSNKGIQEGWNLSRDFVNLFFIIVLIFIALGTIFDLSSFNKNLILKVVLIALTINFSMAIAQFVIGQANNLGLFFLGQIAAVQEAPPGTSKTDFSHGIASALEKIVNFDAAIKASTGELQKTIFKTGDNGKVVRRVWETYEISINAISAGRELSQKLQKNPKNPNEVIFPARLCNSGDPTYQYACEYAKTSFNAAVTQTSNPNEKLAFSIAMKIIIIPVALFILLAAAVLMIGRIVFLSFLMMFAPFYFFSVLLPGYNKFSKWWQDLLNQAFFFPAFMFVFMLSIIFFQALQGTDTGPLATLISYFIGVFLLGFSLIVAQKMGAVGASAAISYGKKARNATLNYAKGRALQGAAAGARPALGALAGVAGSGVDTRFGRIPLGRILTAPGRLGLEKVAGEAKKFSDKQEKSRIERIQQSIDTNPKMGASVYKTFRASDQVEYVKKAKDKQLELLSEHLSNAEIGKMVAAAKGDETLIAKILSNVKGNAEGRPIERVVAIQSGVSKDPPPEADTEVKRAAHKQKYQNAFNQVVGTLTEKQLRKIPDEELEMIKELKEAMRTFVAFDKRITKNFANTEKKAQQMRDLIFETAGYSKEEIVKMRKQIDENNREQNEVLRREVIAKLHEKNLRENRGRDDTIEANLADKLARDNNYRGLILGIPMTQKTVEIPRGGEGEAEEGGGAPRPAPAPAPAPGGAPTP